MPNTVAYMDESGSLPDIKSPYVVLAAIVTQHERDLKKVVRIAGSKLKQNQLKKRGGKEIKWWNAPDGTRVHVLQALAQKDIQVFWVAIEKQGQRIEDSPENYGLMVGELLRECLAYHPQLKVVVDMHFSVLSQREQFDRIVSEYCQLSEPLVHMDSQQDAVIQLADFVAGAILSRLTGKGEFANLIEEKVVVGKTIKWLCKINSVKGVVLFFRRRAF